MTPKNISDVSLVTFKLYQLINVKVEFEYNLKSPNPLNQVGKNIQDTHYYCKTVFRKKVYLSL